MIHFTDLERESTYGQFQFDCHAGTTYEVYSLLSVSTGIQCTYIHTYNFICFSRLQKKAAYADVDLLKTYLKYLQHLIGLILQITLKYL